MNQNSIPRFVNKQHLEIIEKLCETVMSLRERERERERERGLSLLIHFSIKIVFLSIFADICENHWQ